MNEKILIVLLVLMVATFLKVVIGAIRKRFSSKAKEIN